MLVGGRTSGVKAVTGIRGLVIGGCGIVLDSRIGIGLMGLSGPTVWELNRGISMGRLIAAIFILIAIVVSSYTITAYHTCLYIWARDVEKSNLDTREGYHFQPLIPLTEALNWAGG